jgi:hypothetical protein
MDHHPQNPKEVRLIHDSLTPLAIEVEKGFLHLYVGERPLLADNHSREVSPRMN